MYVLLERAGMKREQIRNSALLALTALIWGVAFVAQSAGMEYVGPFTFNGVRSILGGLALLPLILLGKRERSGRQKNSITDKGKAQSRRELIIGGIWCGVVLCAASSLQQIGILYTTVGKAGFITALYIVIVPVLGIFMKKPTGKLLWISVGLAAAGLYFLCMTESFSVNPGDLFVLLGALLFSVHILLIDRFSPRCDGVKLSCIQFFVCGILALIPALLWERPEPAAVVSAWAPVLYAGVLSCGVGYTLQVIGQKGLDPVTASLILSMESLFSVLAGWILLKQNLSSREIIGCVLMAVAIVLAQISPSVHENLT